VSTPQASSTATLQDLTMADARSLLRQQRTARRIDHPHALYSESGKLSCSLCNEPIRSDALWAGHLRSEGHLQRLERLRKASEGPRTEVTAPAPKRKLSDTEDPEQSASDDEATQAKRLKGGAAPAHSSVEATRDGVTNGAATPSRLAPPLLRRTSGTPVHGVEISIPSRPATPLDSSFSASPMPRAGLNERKVSDDANGHRSALGSTAEESPPGRAQATTTQHAVAAVDENEWAAFEAEMLGAPPAAVPNNAVSDAVIIAAPMSAEQVAAAKSEEEEERAKRKAMADLQLEDEKEDATRALETEFDEMEDLEARAKRLRERREALRYRTTKDVADSKDIADSKPVPETGTSAAEQEHQTEEDEVNGDNDSDTDEDDWDAFHLRR
jgi:zinc finger protein 830